MKMVALIPARAGSKRCVGKNTRLLAGFPLIAHTIAAAHQSGIFSAIIVSTESKDIGSIAEDHGAHFMHRPEELATDDSPDIRWVKDALFLRQPFIEEQFAILRPTSPFRTAATIQRAYDEFRRTPDIDSLRAVEPAKQHPGKMWAWEGPGYPITPLFSYSRSDGTPWHSSPTQSLPTFYVQNASLEMAWTRTVTQLGSIAGRKVLPFFTEGYEGFDINSEEDFAEAERIAAAHPELLPHVHA